MEKGGVKVAFCPTTNMLADFFIKKLTRVLQYVGDMTNFTLTFEPSNNPKWWVERSYVIQSDI